MSLFKKLNLSTIAVAVLSAAHDGYRRGGIAFKKGENNIDECDECQFNALEADPKLVVSVGSVLKNVAIDAAAEKLGIDPGTIAIAKVREIGVLHERLMAENATLEDKVSGLTSLCKTQQETIKALEEELTKALMVTHEDTLADLAGDNDELGGLDYSSAPEELHHWIAVIDDLNAQAPLTKKPNCDRLTIQVEGEDVTPTAAERDESWAWYQNNVKVVDAPNVNATSADAE